ncbi:MAG: hypothetical protein V7780_07505 [Colwellia sp.]|jgi:hypothetical protein|uniref:hypothetical protein n=1 Tax=Colwellia sp. Bg11-12 TaxID=2759817 RepID=UPI0015F4329F|nr:hypothetical protein [Colwellia sp. Bg11-12]MBA6265049.1 hypothetical protein [Colwellia sp. Bg11-12]
MRQWQRLLSDGNEFFDNKKWVQAEYCYKEAASYLDNLWAVDAMNIELLMAWIGTCHNLAVLYETRGNPQVSLEYLLIPHHRMLALSQNSQQCDDMQLIALKALQLTFMPVLLFSRKYSICKECQKGLKEFKAQLDENQGTVH